MKPSKETDVDTAGQGAYKKTVYQTLYLAYKPSLFRLASCLLLGVLGRALLLGNTNIIGYWVDSMCRPPTPCRPLPDFLSGLSDKNYVVRLAIMTTVGFFLTLTYRTIFSRISAQAVSKLHDEVTLRTSRYPMRFFDITPAGRIITRFSSDYGNVFRYFGGPLAEFITIVVDLFLMVCLITVANPIFLIFVGGIIVFNFVVYRLNRDRLRRVRRDLSASRSPSIAHFAETTQGASTIRSFLRQGSFKTRFTRLDRFFLDQKRKTFGNLVGFSYQMNSLSSFLLLITGTSSYYLLQNGVLTIGSIGVAFSFIVLSGNTIQMFFEWLAQSEEAMIGVERLDQYLRQPLEAGSYLPSNTQFKTQHPIYSETFEKYLHGRRLTEKNQASIEARNVWFRYGPELPWVLKNINFDVKPGERIGVVGRTGSGKSSLIQALFYLYKIDQGQILINGHAPKLADGDLGPDLGLYRQSIALISQEPVLFQGTLRANLDPWDNLKDSDLLAVLDRVGLAEWVRTGPAILQRRIEERGKNLSLGERQLLCLARCLLQDAPIVIMDEATSSVDPLSEEIMVRATEELFHGKTQIIIAHRLSTLAQCDRILWLDRGEIKMLGQAQEILKEFEKQDM
jgi:ABC-type multidrug transport system fused ATPase/permease subunit